MKQRGFTLTEAIFSVLISSLVIAGIFNYFANSVRNVEKSEKDLISIKQIQRLVTDLRYDLNHIMPLTHSNTIPIDGHPRSERFYNYRVKAFTNISDEAKLIDINQTKITFKPVINNSGETQWQKQRELDNFFDIPVKFSHSWDALENAVINLTHTVDCSKDFEDPHIREKLKSPIEVVDLYLHSNHEKILYRYYPEPNHFVGRFKYDLNDELIETKNYGLDQKTKNGLIRSFQAVPIFDHIYFQESINEPYELHFQKLFIQVDTLVQADPSRGPQAKPYAVNFTITNPQLNAEKFHRGIF